MLWLRTPQRRRSVARLLFGPVKAERLRSSGIANITVRTATKRLVGGPLGGEGKGGQRRGPRASVLVDRDKAGGNMHSQRTVLARVLCSILLAPLLALVLFPAQPAAAVLGLTIQDQTDPGITATTLAQSLAGTGVTISNVTYLGTATSSGQFQGGLTIIGFDEGVILSSGAAKGAVGPNNNDGYTTVLNTPGDADLTALSGVPTFDATVLQFDFVPQASILTFQYVFASDEYNEYANSPFNDTFAFFVNGINCAKVPTTGQPVSINTINGGNPFGTNAKNPLFYRNNDLSDGGGAIKTQAPGPTLRLPGTPPGEPGVTNPRKTPVARRPRPY